MMIRLATVEKIAEFAVPLYVDIDCDMAYDDQVLAEWISKEW